MGAGALGEDIENQPRSVEHPAAQLLLEVALLAGAQGMIENDEGGVRGINHRRDFLELAAPDKSFCIGCSSPACDEGSRLPACRHDKRFKLMLIDGRIAEAKEAVDVASARLAHAMSADANQRIIPMDTTIVPLNLVSLERDRSSLIHAGLSRRPELKEAQALVAAACERHQRETYAPFVPSVFWDSVRADSEEAMATHSAMSMVVTTSTQW